MSFSSLCNSNSNSNSDNLINSSLLNKDERLRLDKLIKDSDDYVDNTEHIRNVKHSKQLITSVGVIELLKKHYGDIKRNDPADFIELCKSKCAFFYNNYTDIFNKLVNDELDLQILSKFLQVLSAIENGQIDQQEGSVIVGRLLKELYVDSALKRGAKLDLKNNSNGDNTILIGDDVSVGERPVIVSRGISWIEYRRNREFLVKPSKLFH